MCYLVQSAFGCFNLYSAFERHSNKNRYLHEIISLLTFTMISIQKSTHEPRNELVNMSDIYFHSVIYLK